MIEDPVLADCCGRLKAAFAKSRLFQQGSELGVPFVTSEVITAAVAAPSLLFRTLRELYDPQLPKIIRNASGRETPGDPAAVELFAIARGQELE